MATLFYCTYLPPPGSLGFVLYTFKRSNFLQILLLCFSIIHVHQKYEQSVVKMSAYGITLRGIFVSLLRGRHEQNVSGRRARRARWLSEESARRPDSYHLREARLERLENFTVYAVDGASHTDGRLFAGHEIEHKSRI